MALLHQPLPQLEHMSAPLKPTYTNVLRVVMMTHLSFERKILECQKVYLELEFTYVTLVSEGRQQV